MQFDLMNAYQFDEVIAFVESLLLHWPFLIRHVVTSVGTAFLREVRILHYLHKNSTMLIIKL